MHRILGSYNELYDVINVISFIALLIFNLTQLRIKIQNLSNISKFFQEKFIKKDNLKKINKVFSNNVFWAIIETIIISCVQYLPITFLNFGFGHIVGTGANYFGLIFFIPYILIAFCLLIRVDVLKQIDLITPAFPLALSISKLACFCAGCCSGIESSFGLYNSFTKIVEFPIQLLESGIALLIFVLLLFWRKRIKTGTMLPTYTIIYSATRFFTEFLRGEPNVVLGLKTYHILCVIGVIVGVAELFIIRKFGDKIKKVCTSKKQKES